MKNNSNSILSFSVKKASLLIIAASTLVVACKKDTKETSVEQLNTNEGSKNAITVAAAENGSGWSEITSTIEANQRVHLEDGNGVETRTWNNGDAWYMNVSGSTSGTSYGSNNAASYTYSASNNKRNTFTLHKAPGNRSEIRIQDNYDTGDIRQFEGIITINNNVFANNAVFQIWGGIIISGAQRATLLQIRGDGAVNGGQLRVVPNGVTNEVGSRTIATNILNTPTTINVVHFQEIASRPGRIVIYVNGDEKYSCEENQVPTNGDGTNYMKYGNYGREDEDANKTNSVVTWSNVRYWEIPKVTVRQGCNYTGWSASLSVGDYTLSQLQALGFVNDDASSIRVPSGLRVRVYANNNFDTLIGTFTSDQSCFSSSVNDRISSIRVEQVQ
ncbi:hypothetical protein [Pedobacter glucosidilyticus]|uniref:hypothetical protein n=1 Tax=Pedobacter glucosidilyticus TaxID=1122941 RepID=UPI0026EC0576|nr:hypothetical protein [Pedobacter glucosidilyticus]